MSIDSKRIAKNTLFMYIRMILVMGITFFTSRIVLDKLGVDDYGLYNAVAGVVGVLSFLNNTLSKGTSRFITYELGTGNAYTLRATFSTAFYTHIFLMIILLVFLETFGSWFLKNKLVIPDGRMCAAYWVYQVSLLTMCLGIIQVPFTSCIIAHEDMSLYAYLGVFEAVGKLIVAYLLIIATVDKMILYAILMLCIHLIIFLVYVLFCKKRYYESSYYKKFDFHIFRNILGFSGWNVIANLTETLKIQGSNILVNMFFKPSLVAAQSVSNQVTNIMLNFIYQFTTALNPQIIKSYAEGDTQASKTLTLQSTILVFDLVLLICLPLIYIIEPILNIWLVEVPEKTVSFIRISLVTQIVNVFNITFYTPMVASGKLKSNSLCGVFLGIGQFILAYVLYKQGYGVLCLSYLILISTFVYSFFIKPLILYNEIGYKIKEMALCYFDCLKVLFLSVAGSLLLYHLIRPMVLLEFVTLAISIILTIMLSAIICMKKELRVRLLNILLKK